MILAKLNENGRSLVVVTIEHLKCGYYGWRYAGRINYTPSLESRILLTRITC